MYLSGYSTTYKRDNARYVDEVQLNMYGICTAVAPSGVSFFSGFLTHDVLLLTAPVCLLYRMDLLIRGQKVIA